MITFTTRQREILKIILDADQPIGSVELANLLHITPKQVNYSMKGVNHGINKRKRYAVASMQQEQQRKTAEAELQRSEERYRSLVETLNEVVFTLDLDGNLIYVSPAIEQVSGYSPEELTGESFVRFVYPDDLPGLQASFAETLAGRLEPYEFRVLSRHGVLRWVRTSGQPQFHDGRLVGVIGTLTAITQRKNAEEAPRRRVDELDAVSRISTTLTSGIDLHILLESLLGQLIAQLGIDAADILLFRPASQGLEYPAARGFSYTAS